MKKTIIFCILVLFVSVSGVFAQWPDKGKLNVWTLATVSHTAIYEDLTVLKDIRVAKGKGYDRIVFEFTGGLPRYQIKYVKASDLVSTGEETIKVSGKFFIDANMQMLPYPDDPKAVDVKVPKGNQHLGVFNEIKQVEWFEGVREFAIGLSARRTFRVQELTRPFRLVIDFKH